ASCRPHTIAYCCTASSIVQGVSYDRQLQQELEAATGVPTFTAVGAIIDALNELGVKTITIASPYTDAMDQAEEAFFDEAVFLVLRAANLGMTDSFELASPTVRDIFKQAGRAWHPDADALLKS